MIHRSNHLERFVRAVHRRMLLIGAAERIGAALVAGCAAGVLLLPILIWRGQPTGEFSAGVLAVAVGAGLLWAIVSRPSQFAAAAECDRQLRWSDLLTTAWMMSRRSGDAVTDPVLQSVLACAEARCRQTSPSAVILNRMGRRAWSGVALAIALAGSLSLVGTDGRRSQAAASPPGGASWMDAEDRQAAGESNVTRLAHRPRLGRPPVGTGGDPDPMGAPINPSDNANTSTAAGAAPREGSNATDGGAGAGSAQSDSSNTTGAKIDPAAGGAASSNATGQASSGGAGAASAGTDGAGGASGGTSPPRQVAPWHSSDWPADRQAADDAIQSGRIPDLYRPFVRDYFENR